MFGDDNIRGKMAEYMHINLLVCIFVGLSGATIRNGHDCRRSTQGTDYFGKINTTVSGRTCQRWDSDFPHPHNFTNDLYYPEKSVSKAENFCRNPETSPQTELWCYTTDPDVEWEHCSVPQCASFPECKQTTPGDEYRGHEEVTSSGTPCVTWGSGYPDLRLNYCRNPDLKPDGPWCFTDPGQTIWEYCDVSLCKPSAACMTSSDGSRYVGTAAMTTASIPCQRWDSNIPHVSNYTDPADFPDTSLQDAADFCRNPGSDKLSPWCYTTDPDVEWAYCDIPTCTGCKVSDTGVEYAGTVSLTGSGLTCQRWDSQTPHPHGMTDPDRFPDASLQDAANYCRNPDKDPDGPWCYTANPGVVRESCNIQLCEDHDQVVRNVRHVVHIGIDGLHPCFVKANVSNIMDRMAAAGSYTINKGRSVIPTWSLPSWTATQCSFPVESSGVHENEWRPQWLGYHSDMTPITGPNVPIPCLTDILKRTDANVHTAFFYSWYELNYLASTGSPGRLDKDLYCDPEQNGGFDVCDLYVANNGSVYLDRSVCATESSYTWIYLDFVDETGHMDSWCTDSYLRAVSEADQRVGMILDAIDSVGMEDEIMVLITTDHGGHGRKHGTYITDDLQIPAFFRGPGIKRNYQFQYEVKIIDIAPTILHAMGFKASPWWSGRVLDEMFEDSSRGVKKSVSGQATVTTIPNIAVVYGAVMITAISLFRSCTVVRIM